jgi:hypothetical protein
VQVASLLHTSDSQQSAKRSGSKMMLLCDYRIAIFENQNLITVIAQSAKRSGSKMMLLCDHSIAIN